jgi:hypothetical protein
MRWKIATVALLAAGLIVTPGAAWAVPAAPSLTAPANLISAGYGRYQRMDGSIEHQPEIADWTALICDPGVDRSSW